MVTPLQKQKHLNKVKEGSKRGCLLVYLKYFNVFFKAQDCREMGEESE